MPFDLATAVALATTTIWAQEFIVLLPTSIELVYMALNPLGIGMLVHILNRGSPLPVAGLFIYGYFADQSPEVCSRLYKAGAWFIMLGLFHCEGILYLRTWAICRRTKGITLFLLSLTALAVPASCYIVYRDLETWEFTERPDGAIGCHLESASRWIVASYLILMISETVVFIITMYQRRKYLRDTPIDVPWMTQVYRDGILFYLIILVTTAFNFTLPFLIRSVRDSYIFAFPGLVLHTILCNRVIISILRQRQYSTTEYENNGKTSTQVELDSVLSAFVPTENAWMQPVMRPSVRLDTIQEASTYEEKGHARISQSTIETSYDSQHKPVGLESEG